MEWSLLAKCFLKILKPCLAVHCLCNNNEQYFKNTAVRTVLTSRKVTRERWPEQPTAVFKPYHYKMWQLSSATRHLSGSVWPPLMAKTQIDVVNCFIVNLLNVWKAEKLVTANMLALFLSVMCARLKFK